MSTTVSDLCTQRGVTIPQLAEQTGLDPSRIAAIAEGRWTPSPTEREKVAAALGVAIEEITWGHKTPIQHLWG
jgi:transcriptional regulator with XRE-family HTH domain